MSRNPTISSSSSRPTYSPFQLLYLQSKAAQLAEGVLPDLPCVSTSPPSSTTVTLPSLPPTHPTRRMSSTQNGLHHVPTASMEGGGGSTNGPITTTSSTSWRTPNHGLPPKPVHSFSSDSSSPPIPLFQQTPKPNKVTIRSPNSTSPPTPISPASPPPAIVASPTSPGHSSTSSSASTPFFQQARASKVSIKAPSTSSSSPKEDPVPVGVKLLGAVTKIPGSGGGVGGGEGPRPVIPPSLSSPSSVLNPPSQVISEVGGSLIDLEVAVEAKRAIPSPLPPTQTLGVDDLDLAVLSFTSPSSELPPSSSVIATTLFNLTLIDSPAEELSGWDLPSSSPSAFLDATLDDLTSSSASLLPLSPPTPKLISPLASPPPELEKQPPPPPPPTRVPTDDETAAATSIPTPPTSPTTSLVTGARAQRAVGSTPSGRMIAGALGLSRDRTGGVGGVGGGSGGYVRPEIKVDRKLSGKELDDKILRIREENRRIEAEHQKEEVDALIHSPTRSRQASFDERSGVGAVEGEERGEGERKLKRASAQRRLSQAETEIERLKRELDRAVQVEIDTERDVAREKKLKAAGSGSLDWDAAKSPTSPNLQPLPLEQQPFPDHFNRTPPLDSPFERPSRPRFPSDGTSPDARRTSSGYIEKEDDGGWGVADEGIKGDATPTRSLTPIATPSADLLTPKPSSVKFNVGSSRTSAGSNLQRMHESTGSSGSSSSMLGSSSPFLVHATESSSVPAGWKVEEGTAGEEDEENGSDEEETGGWGV